MAADKTGTISFRYFIKGDYVITGNGVGIVLEDEQEIFNEQELRFSDVFIQHKSGNSNNTGNHPIKVDRESCSIISKAEYDFVKC